MLMVRINGSVRVRVFLVFSLAQFSVRVWVIFMVRVLFM
jgi:hypothetical protein